MRCARAGRRCSSTLPPAPSSCRASPPWRGRCRLALSACPLLAESPVSKRASPWQVHEDASHVGAHTVELRLGVTEQKRDAAQARLPLAFSRLAVRGQASGPAALRAIPTNSAQEVSLRMSAETFALLHAELKAAKDATARLAVAGRS